MARSANRSTPDRPTDLDGAGYYHFARELEEDRRRTRLALVGAVVVHLLLFIAPLGLLEPEHALAAPRPREIFVVEPIRFEPPPPERQRELPPPRAPRVPIPDPTPDDPEPLRLDEEIPQRIDLPEVDLVAAIPDAPPPVAADEPIPVGGDVVRPVRLAGPEPRYTEIARRARIEGVVIVEAIIDKQGKVTDVRVVKALPMGLDQAAVEAIRQWRFAPATLDGRPVDVSYSLTVNFRLQR